MLRINTLSIYTASDLGRHAAGAWGRRRQSTSNSSGRQSGPAEALQDAVLREHPAVAHKAPRRQSEH